MEIAIVLFVFFSPAFFFAYRAYKWKKEVKRLNDVFRPYQVIEDAKSYAASIAKEAQGKVDALLREEHDKADVLVREAQDKVDVLLREGYNKADVLAREAQDKARMVREIVEKDRKLAEKQVEEAVMQAKAIISEAEEKAAEIAGDALKAKENAAFYEKTVRAIKNTIEGYGNEYIIPGHSLLDDLADEYGYTQAGEELKMARSYSRELAKMSRAGVCDYVDSNRSNTAVNFVVDAFNGKVDSILSRVKVDNYGKLKQEIVDAFYLVNNNGQAFRSTRITNEYLAARLKELRLACTVHEIRQRDIEEQRRIREQMREEEKSRRENEKVQRDAEKEEDTLKRAMDKAREQMEKASEEQQARYEAQIAELEQKWKEAEERKQRAESNAQHTKSGHVYITSNIGSFGENVYKIGMTRRWDPEDRIKELGDASVPFPFDIHAMIRTDNAPGLEAALHKKFALGQVNKVNYRKEFFKIPLQAIREEIEEEYDYLEVKWTMAAEAREYRESLAIEESLKENPEAQKAWLERQFEIEEQEPLETLKKEDEI